MTASDRRAQVGRLIRFVIVGLVGTAIYFGLTMTLVSMGYGIETSHWIGYLVSIAASYFGQKIFTFGIRGQHTRSGPRFILATVGIAAAQFALIVVLNNMSIDQRLIVVISTGYYPVASFIIHNLWTFRAKKVAE